MLITLAQPWSNPADGQDAEPIRPNTTLEVDDVTARIMISDGRARAAGCVIETEGEAGDGDSNAEPPRQGAGSGRDAWAEYAARQNVDVPADATRDEIVAALHDAGTNAGVESAHTTESPATGENSEGVS